MIIPIKVEAGEKFRDGRLIWWQSRHWSQLCGRHLAALAILVEDILISISISNITIIIISLATLAEEISISLSPTKFMAMGVSLKIPDNVLSVTMPCPFQNQSFCKKICSC